MIIDWYNDPEGREFLKNWHAQGLPFEYNTGAPDGNTWFPSTRYSQSNWLENFEYSTPENRKDPKALLYDIKFRILRA